MSLASARFTTAVPSAVGARLDAASRNAPPIRKHEPMRGAVRAVQQALLDLDDPRLSMAAGADGLFGSQTAQAVRQFQQARGLIVDGIVGAQTMGELDRIYSPAISGQPKGISLHFGLNGVDPAQYQGWDGALTGCEPDARDMKVIADSRGFKSRLVLTREATSNCLFSELRAASAQLVSGDILLLSYSGHGGQVPNTNGDDEADGMDETWCLFDREIVDDELFAAFARFASGVRIFVLSDSCHSGTATRVAEFSAVVRAAQKEASNIKPRAMPEDVSRKVYQAHRALYDALQAGLPDFERAGVNANVLLISGCQDNQLSGDMGTNGVFTNALKRIWNNGQFQGNYRSFHRAIRAIMPLHQQPNLFTYGGNNNGFVGQRPFSI